MLTALTVACVLRSGGDYKPEHVSALRDGVRRHLRMPHRFVCLTDLAVDCITIPLRHDWPGWWPKIELFSHHDIGPVLYFDLDTIIVGPLDEIATGHRFTVLQNFWTATGRIGSGMMAWDCDLSAIYRAFMGNPRRFMEDYRSTARWGDQAFIIDHTPVEPERWQSKHPGKVVSYKLHCRINTPAKSAEPGRAVVPAGASVVCYHGNPRPWHTPLWAEQRQVA